MTAVAITTSTASNPIGNPWAGQSSVAWQSTGGLPRLWVALYDGADIEMWYSNDYGATWAESTSYKHNVGAVAVTGLGLMINKQGMAALVVTLTSGASAKIFTDAALAVGGTWDNTYTTFGGGIYGRSFALIPMGNPNYPYNSSGSSDPNDFFTIPYAYPFDLVSDGYWGMYGKTYYKTTGAEDGGDSYFPNVYAQTDPPNAVSVHAMDWRHTGDGSTVASSTPDLYWISDFRTAAGSRPFFCRTPWSSGAKSWSWSSTNKGATVAASPLDYADVIFDGTRAYAVFVTNGAPTTCNFIHDNATFTNRVTGPNPPASPNGNFSGLALSAPSPGSTDDDYLYLYSTQTTTDDIYVCVYTKSTATWGTWTVVETTTTVDKTLCALRHETNGTPSIGYLWVSGTTIYWERQTLNNAAPVTTITVPSSPYVTKPHGVNLNVQWTFTDLGDTQDSWELTRQPLPSGTLNYYNASLNTWSASQVINPGAATSVNLQNWSVTDGDSYEIKVRTTDINALTGAWSNAVVVRSSTVVVPVITTPAHSGSWTSSFLTTTWTATEQTAFQIDLYTSGDVLLYSTGVIISAALSYKIEDYVLSTGTTYKVKLTNYNADGIVTGSDTNTFSTTFTAPSTPTVAVTKSDANGYISVDPTFSGGATVTEFDVFVRVASGGTQDVDRTVNDNGIRIAKDLAAAAVFLDYAAASGVNYQYRVLGKASSNGTATYSAWT